MLTVLAGGAPACHSSGGAAPQDAAAQDAAPAELPEADTGPEAGGPLGGGAGVPRPEDFVFGWYDGLAPEAPAKEAATGANVMMPYAGDTSPTDLVPYLDAAGKAGAKVLVEITRSKVMALDFDGVRDFVRALKGNPNILAWYSYDEPELNGISAATMKKVYDTVKAEDPSRPIALVMVDTRSVAGYAGSFDIFMWDDYPCTKGTDEYSTMKKFRRTLLAAADAAKAAPLGFWPVIQAYGQNAAGAPQYNHRLPTGDEERYMVFTSLLTGPKGVFFWWWPCTLPSWVDGVLTPLVKEVQAYVPAIRAGRLPGVVSSDNPDVETVLYADPASGAHLLVAVHHELGSASAGIRLDPSIPSGSVTVTRDGSTLDAIDGAFTDTFGSFEVRVYDVR